MLVQALLGWRVVIRRDHQRRVRPRFLGVLSQGDRFRGTVGAGTRDYRDASFRDADADLRDAHLLFVIQGR